MSRPPVPPSLAKDTGTQPVPRLAVIDIARGTAIVQMIAYHFCYDLNYFGWIRVAMNQDPGWIAWRSAIVTQFLLIVGVCLALPGGAAAPGAGGRIAAHALRSRRWWQIAGCAALVSGASALLFGARWIWFGILHFVVVAEVLLAPLRGRPRTSLVVGVLALGLGLGVTLPMFAANGLSWIGFSPVKPRTEDFVPLLPWVGVVLIGMAAGSLWRQSPAAWARGLRGPDMRAAAPLVLLGRWPLTVYMLHQPVLFGALALVRWAGHDSG